MDIIECNGYYSETKNFSGGDNHSKAVIINTIPAVSIQINAISGVLGTGVILQSTIDPPEKIRNDTALWVDIGSGAQTTSFSAVPLGIVKAVRLEGVSGEWRIAVRTNVG